jgi:glycerol-3-phosphate dehydrogenase
MTYDICIIGGGINGVGIARDAAGRGLKVLLLEQGDLGGRTSSNSSKMIHGGLRYLEFYEFGLVRKALAERQILMSIAPQIVSPLRFCIPHRDKVRPAWLIRLGLFIYDHLSVLNKLPPAETINLENHPYSEPLSIRSGKGFCYSDCWVDDARLVILNAIDGRNHGADIYVRTKVDRVEAGNSLWSVYTDKQKFQARCLVNAAGPYARQILDTSRLVQPSTPSLKLVQGSHIIVPRLYEGNHAYLLQGQDRRVVFVWPYLGRFSLVGTTETVFHGDPKDASLTNNERDYLLNIINSQFTKKTEVSDIVSHYSGVRPLFDDGAEKDMRKVTRDYKLSLDSHDGAPILNIFGGKLTTYRTLAEEAVTLLQSVFPGMGGTWTSHQKLPNIDFPFEPNEATLRYFISEEWAREFEDVLWRRTKWGLTLDKEKIIQLEEVFNRILREESLNA